MMLTPERLGTWVFLLIGTYGSDGLAVRSWQKSLKASQMLPQHRHPNGGINAAAALMPHVSL
jgi:hypothetical protein